MHAHFIGIIFCIITINLFNANYNYKVVLLLLTIVTTKSREMSRNSYRLQKHPTEKESGGEITTFYLQNYIRRFKKHCVVARGGENKKHLEGRKQARNG